MSETIIHSFIRGVDKALVLWLLDQGPRSGYNLIVELQRLTGERIGPTLMYTFLSDLESNGYLTGRLIKNGRKIKEYWLTNKGRGLLEKIRELFQTSLSDMLMDVFAL
jgi:DNA-binding PadR family transcriptional regulator